MSQAFAAEEPRASAVDALSGSTERTITRPNPDPDGAGLTWGVTSTVTLRAI